VIRSSPPENRGILDGVLSVPRQWLLARWLLAALLLAPHPSAGALARGGLWFSSAAAALLAPAPAEAARFGGGRTFGFRGARGFSRRGFGRSAFGRGYRRPYYRRGVGLGLPFFYGFPLFGFGYGIFGLLRLFLVPLLLIFILRRMSRRR